MFHFLLYCIQHFLVAQYPVVFSITRMLRPHEPAKVNQSTLVTSPLPGHGLERQLLLEVDLLWVVWFGFFFSWYDKNIGKVVSL